MTWIKICGITNLEDALVAVEAGADAVGFVFYEKSARCVSVETARGIVEKLPENVEKIGVFAGGDVEPVDVLHDVGLTGMQSYLLPEGGMGKKPRKATGAACAPPRFRFVVALPIGLFLENEASIHGLAADFANWGNNLPEGAVMPKGMLDTFLLDSGNPSQPGGTGKAFGWQKAVPLAEGMRVGGLKLVVAGGLTPKNVGDAIEILRPWGVDVSSGVEAQLGKKDPEKVKAFVRAVREADRKAG